MLIVRYPFQSNIIMIFLTDPGGFPLSSIVATGKSLLNLMVCNICPNPRVHVYIYIHVFETV